MIGNTAKATAKATQRGISISVEAFLKGLRALGNFIKQIPKHLDSLKLWIDELIASLKAKALLIDGVAFVVVDPITLLGKLFFNVVRTKAWNKLNNLGVKMVKTESGLFNFEYNGIKLAIKSLTKAEAEDFLKNLFVKSKDKSDDVTKKYLDDLAESKKIRTQLLKDVPGIKQFGKWFDDLTVSEFEIVWKNIKLRKAVQRRLRHPGGYHEWLMVSRADVFKKWNVSASQIEKLRTKIKEVVFTNPPGVHGGKGSTKAHNEILKLIDNSNNYDEFVEKLILWADRRLKGGSKKLPKGFF